MNMNVSGIRWSDQQVEKEIKRNRVLGKGFDEILNTEMNSIKKNHKLGGSMKYTVISAFKAEELINAGKSSNLYIIDTNYNEELCLYPVLDLSLKTLTESFSSGSEFLYKNNEEE